MYTVVIRLAWQATDGDLKLSRQEAPIELLRTGVNNGELDARVATCNRLQEINELPWRNRAHDADSQRRLFETGKFRCDALGGMGLIIHTLQVRHYDSSQL